MSLPGAAIKSTSNDVSSNFHVCVRIRPTSSASYENQGHSENQKYVRAGPENSILLVQPHSTQGDKVFIYDEVFDTNCKTRDIFEKVIKPNLGESLFKGFSHTILVYGMTGSGKTYTMFGDNCSESQQQQQQQQSNPITFGLLGNSNDSVNPQRVSMNTDALVDVDGPLKGGEVYDASDCKGGIVSETVKLVLANQSENQKTKMRMSYLEIYNEQIRDLLSNEAITADNLMILEDPDKGVYCPLLSEKEINGLDQISALIRTGNRRRVMASTKLNQFSSRSHAIIQLSLEIEIANNGKVTTFLTPKLYLVDLAGSERASTAESKGVRLKEGSNINKSLLSLGNCITVLSSADKAKRHVPYRDSKLTRLLKESLGGNAKTILIACVTPAFRFVEESINTLKYAQRAKSIKKEVYENVKQIYNALEKNSEVKVVQEEIESLKELLQQNAMTGGNPEEILGELCALGNNATDEEVMRKLQSASGGPPTEEQVLSSSQFQSHKARFAAQFQRLSEHFEDILFRNRELECNLGEHKQAKEQNERLIHEIMDTINPSSLTQKDMSYRLDKVNMLRGLIKNNDDVVNRLIQERQENEQIKDAVKRELESLYEVKFISECRELSNFQLYTSFEQEKRKLQQQIDLLQEEQRQRAEESKRKDSQIAKLKDEIQFVKKKAAQTEVQLQQQQEILKQKNIKGRGRFLNIRSSTFVQGSKVTPRNLSQSNATGNNNSSSNNVSNTAQSKYLQVQTFVPSSNISASSLRGKSANMRASMYNSRKNNQSEQSEEIIGIKSMIDVFSSNGGQSSPSTREYEEYRRKEFIIESQLKNLQKPSSTKNAVYGQRISENIQGATTHSSTNFQSPNRQSNHAYKSSFKSSFIDLAPTQNAEQISSGQTTALSQDSNSMRYNLNNNNSNRDHAIALTEPDLVSNVNINAGSFGNSSSYDYNSLGGLANSTGSLSNSNNGLNGNLSNSYQPSSSGYQSHFQHFASGNLYNSPGTAGLSQNGNSLNGSQQFNNSVSSESEQSSNQRKSDINHYYSNEDNQVKRSSFNTDSANKKSKTVTIVDPAAKQSPQQIQQTSAEKTFSGVFSPIIESLQEQSMLNSSLPNDPTPVNFKPTKDSKFLIENKQQYKEQNVLLDPQQEFLFISSSQLTAQQPQQQQPQQFSQPQSTFKYSSPYSQSQKSSLPQSSPYQNNQVKNKNQPFASNNNSNNNSNYNYTPSGSNTYNNITQNANVNYVQNSTQIHNGLAASYDFSNYNNKINNQGLLNKANNYTNSGNYLSVASPGVETLKINNNNNTSSSNPLSKSTEIVQQQKPQPKIVNPSFNNYMQNHATYGVINQSLGIVNNPAQIKPVQIPTTAINLNLNTK